MKFGIDLRIPLKMAWRPLRGLASILMLWTLTSGAWAAHSRPNIILILVDDMGFSDIGCYGSEIPTPNIDQLAAEGVRLTQFYNTSRCCPTRASLLTGLFQHQAGIGMMTTQRPNVSEGYLGYLNQKCVTIAEVLKPAGYHTYMVGKWHMGRKKQEWWPLQRGFERYYGILSGATNYFKPGPSQGLTLDNQPLKTPDDPDYYTTDVFTDYAIQFVKEQPDENPFFLYVAYNAPHWPLQAKPEDIKKFVGHYRMGWDQLRRSRWQRQLELGIVKKEWGLSPRDPMVPAWDDLTPAQQKDLDGRMATYAAQIASIDDNVGRLVATLKERKKFDNTLILFLSDNGGCPEPWNDRNPSGKSHLGGGEFLNPNKPELGGAHSYGQGWANASNTPFRRYKTQSHEGGISTPLIMHWPAGIKIPPGTLTDAKGYLIDIMPTLIEVAEASYPAVAHGQPVYPLEGRSLIPLLNQQSFQEHQWMFWEHNLEGAVRYGDWKAIWHELTDTWSLYNIALDRNELNDLAGEKPRLLKEMKARWNQWALTHGVLPKKIPATSNN